MLDRIKRQRVRQVAAGLAAATAALYFLIGLGVIRVAESSTATTDLFQFGAMAGGAFVFGALLLVVTDRRELWVMGALLQMVVLVGYVAAADMRTPAFEFWGLAIKVFQVLLLVALAYLALRPTYGGATRGAVRQPLTR